MSEKKIVVPDGMLQAASSGMAPLTKEAVRGLRHRLEAGLRWILEDMHTIVSRSIFDRVREDAMPSGKYPGDEAFRAMLDFMDAKFVAREPEMPEAIKDLIVDDDSQRNADILIAYRRGLAKRGN